MLTNSYEGVLENWKVRLICQRARRMGFRGFDLDDVQQQVALALLDFCFDETKSNGANEATALTAVIDRQLAMIRRSEGREEQRREIAKRRCERYYDLTETELSLDVENAIRSLSELDQQVCRGLSMGNSMNQIAGSLGISWHTVRDRVEAIRRHFEQLGLEESCLSGKEAVSV